MSDVVKHRRSLRLANGIRVLEAFLSEAAVLLAVFPILDEFVQYGRKGVTLRLVVISLVGSALLLTGAVVLAITTEEREDA